MSTQSPRDPQKTSSKKGAKSGALNIRSIEIFIFCFSFAVILIRWIINMKGFPQLNANDTANIVFWHFLFRSDTVRVIPETPKPLLAVIYGVLYDLRLLWFTEILKTAAFAFIPAFFFKIFYNEFKDVFYGIISAVVIFSLTFVLIKPDTMVPSLLYATVLLFIALYFFLAGRGGLTSLFLLLAGLMRNDFWFFGGLYILYSLVSWKKLDGATKRTFFLPIFSPFLWVLFDWKVGGSYNYSSQTVKYVSELLKFTRAPLTFYLKMSGILIWAATFKNLALLALGILGTLFLSVKKNKLSWTLTLFFLFPFLEVFGLYPFEPPPLSARFFFPTFLLLYALSPIGWKLLFERLKITKGKYWISISAVIVFGATVIHTLKYYDRDYLSVLKLRNFSLFTCSKYAGDHGFDKYEGIITHQGLSLVPVATGHWDAINRTYSLLEVRGLAYDFRDARYAILALSDRPSREFIKLYAPLLKEVFRSPGGVSRIYLIAPRKGTGSEKSEEEKRGGSENN